MSQQLVELMIFTRKRESKDGRKFTSYSTKYNFKDAETGERKSRYCTVKFTQDAFEGSPVKLSDIKRGKLTVDASQVGIPDVWNVTQKDGKDVYPVCYIRGGIKGFTPIVKEHEFHFDTEDIIEEESELPEEIEESKVPNDNSDNLDSIDLPDDDLEF